MYRTSPQSDLFMEYYDLFSEDSCQDWFFVCSAFQVAFGRFSQTHPNIKTATLISDNGSCFHSRLLLFHGS